MPPFEVGEAVVCVDASDIPQPWKPLECGHTYVIRSIERMDKNENVLHNIHKNTTWAVRVWGVNNITQQQGASMTGLGASRGDCELAYAATRFEKIYPDEMSQTTNSKMEEVA